MNASEAAPPTDEACTAPVPGASLPGALYLSQPRPFTLETTFRPRLVGPVLTGAVDRYSEVCLHLFSDPPEDVAIFLLENGITHEQGEARVRFDAADPVRLPAFRFLAGESPVELIVFSARVRGRVPLSPVDGRPMRRAGLAEVEALTEALA